MLTSSPYVEYVMRPTLRASGEASSNVAQMEPKHSSRWQS